MKKKRFNFSNLLENGKFRFLLSFLAALGLWAYVALVVNDEHTDIIRNVPINMTYRRNAYQSLGLDAVESDVQSVDVTVTGSRRVTGDLTADDIIIYPNITGVEGPGTYSFALTAEKTSSVKDFSITSISTDVVRVRFDRVISKQFTVEADISSLVVAGDFMADTPVINPATITVTGPEYKVTVIDRVVASPLSSQTISSSVMLPGELSFYDENGADAYSEYLNLSDDSVSITVPVLKEVTLPLKIEYLNVPEGFNTDTLHRSISQSEINLAVPTGDASSLTEFVAGYIDLEDLRTDEPYVFDIELPAGYKSMDDLAQVTATVSGSGISERTITVSDIRVINDAEDDIEVVTKAISNVTVIGDSDVVESLKEGSVIAQIDGSKITAAQGQQTVRVNFVIPGTDRAYVMGSYTATIRK